MKMDSNPEVLTPKNKCRRLGLKRTIQKGTIPKTPLSDVKVNYKSLQSNVEASPSTPSVEQKLPLRTSAYTTNCLPYRLSLSRRVRDKYKKKKLEFSASTHDLESESLCEETIAACEIEETRPTDLLQQIESNERIIKSHQKHQAKVDELKTVINIWKEAFKASLEELSSKIEPRMEPEDLIARLGITAEMIDYA